MPVDLTMRYKGYSKPNMQIMCSFKDIAARRCYHQVCCNEVVHAVVEHDQRANCNLNRPGADCNLVLTLLNSLLDILLWHGTLVQLPQLSRSD